MSAGGISCNDWGSAFFTRQINITKKYADKLKRVTPLSVCSSYMSLSHLAFVAVLSTTGYRFSYLSRGDYPTTKNVSKMEKSHCYTYAGTKSRSQNEP